MKEMSSIKKGGKRKGFVLKGIQYITRIILSFLIVFMPLISGIPVKTFAAGSIGTIDGTYDFSGPLGPDNSAGSGFATFGDKFVVSNGFHVDGTQLFSDPNITDPGGAPTGIRTLVIKTEGSSTCKTFTFKDLGISAFGNNTYFESFKVHITTKDDSTIKLVDVSNPNPGIKLPNSVVQISTLFNGNNQYNIQNVKSISITFSVDTHNPADFNFENITIADVSANATPTATGVSIAGAPQVGQVITGSYAYVDADGDIEGTSIYKWYRSNDVGGSGKVAINGATSQTYKPTADDEGKYISFEVTPVASAGETTGSPVESPLVGPIIKANQAPTDIALSFSSFAENASSGTTIGTLSATDPDEGATHTYSIVSGDTTNFTISGNQLKTNGEFDFETKNSYSIRIRVTDSGMLTYEKDFTISVTDVNEAPILNRTSVNLTGTNEDTESSGVLVSSFLDSMDQDSGALKGIAVSGTTGNGEWQYFDSFWKPIPSVSNNNALLLRDIDIFKYIPDSINGETATLTFRAWDRTTGSPYSLADVTTNGGSTAFSAAVGTASMNVTSENDAPNLTSGPYSFNVVAKNTTSTEVTVAAIASMSDVDIGATSGIAINHTTGNGTWEYSLDGLTWQAFGTVTETSSLLLRATDKIRYQSSNLGEIASFAFRGWDQSSGTQGTKVDTTTNGGTTAFSSNTQTASIEVQKSSEANILSFSIPQQLKPAEIDDGTIYVEVAGTQDISNLIPMFAASDNVQFVKVGGVTQTSGTSNNNFSNPVTYVVTAEDGTNKNWIVTVNRVPTDITLSNNTVDEKVAAGTEVGILNGIDQDGDAALSYAIQAGDTTAFEIDNNRLITKAVLNYNVKNQYSLTIRVTDQHGAYSDKAFTINVLDKTPPTADVTMTSNNGQDPTKAKVGDTITLNIVTNEVITAPTVTIAGNNALVSDNGDSGPNTWQATYVMQTGDAEGIIPFTVDFKDVSNNTATQVTAVTTGTAVTLDKTAPIATTVTIASNNADPTKAKVGDKIILSIGTSENVQTPTVTILGNSATVTNNGAPTSWLAEYTIQNGDSAGPIEFTLDLLDIAGNSGMQVTNTSDGSSVTALSNNAMLTNLTLSNGILEPKFAPNETSYTVNVGYDVTAIDITPSVADATATVKVNDTTITNGAAVSIPLAIGPNVITVEVTAQDYTTKTYTITITRLLSDNVELSNLIISEGLLSPDFNPNITNYSANVNPSVSVLTIAAIPKQKDAKVAINGKVTTADTITLNFGSNSIPVVVTAQDGITTRNYMVTINRLKSGNADLGSLAVDKGTLTPAFSPSVDVYRVNVDYNTTQISISAQVADLSSSLTMNGRTVTPTPTIAAPSMALTTPDSISLSLTTSDTIQVSMTETFDLQVGSNPIPVTVTAQDGGTKIYTITVIRQAASTSDDEDDDNDNGTGGGGGSTTTPSNSNGGTNGQSRNVNVDLGEGNSPIAQVGIIRTTTEDGKQLDTVVFDNQKAKAVVERVLQENEALVRIVIDDLPDNPADEVAVTVPIESINELVSGDLSLEIQTEDVKVTIPKEALKAINQLGIDLNFTIIPIRDENEKKNVEERTINAAEVQRIAGNSKVLVHGKPMTIETNLKDHQTKVVFPLKGLQLPNDPIERKALLDGLAVYIEHSDGEKKVQQGKVIYDNQGNPEGLEIEITKFSTFTIISIEQENESVLESNLKDIKGHWAEKPIRHLVSKGVVNGYPDGTFKPNQTVTRAEFVAMVIKALNVKEAGDVQTFTDIKDHWAKNVIEQAATNGIVNGLSKERFGPNEQINREQMAAIIVKAGKLEIVNNKTNFLDYNNISSWAEGSVNTAAHYGIVNGLPNQTFNPKGKATRAEAATVIMNLLNLNN